MSDAATRVFFESLLNLGPEWEVADVTLDECSSEVIVDLTFSTQGKTACPICRTASPLYDHSRPRKWRHLDMMGKKTFLRARIPRANCPNHGPHSLEIPWATRQSRFTIPYEDYVIKVLDCAKSVASACGLLKSGWGACERILKKVTELSQLQRASAVRDHQMLKRRYRALATLINTVEETVLDVARRAHRKSSWLSKVWVDEVRVASGGLINVAPPVDDLLLEESWWCDDHVDGTDTLTQREAPSPLGEDPATGTIFIQQLERLTAPYLAAMEEPEEEIETLMPDQSAGEALEEDLTAGVYRAA